jgi:hypothetical protein
MAALAGVSRATPSAALLALDFLFLMRSWSFVPRMNHNASKMTKVHQKLRIPRSLEAVDVSLGALPSRLAKQ